LHNWNRKKKEQAEELRLIDNSTDEIKELSNIMPVASRSAVLSQVPLIDGDEQRNDKAFPVGRFDVFDQQLDLRETNSWLMKLHEIPTIELIEVHAINSLSPFILCSRLKPLMLNSPEKNKYIVNVSAMEGKFYRHKTDNHPHTNMAKASLNMLTRTSAIDYADSSIWMTAVDTGWVTDENPYDKKNAYAQRSNFQAPLDEIEGMARILDPIFTGINSGINHSGIFFKDYHETEW